MTNTRRNDLLLVALIALAALLLWGGVRLLGRGGAALDAVVTVDGARMAALPLGEDARLEIVNEQGGVNLLVIEAGRAYIESADCANQVCVHSRPISREGELIVCLPHKLVVAIERHEER